MTSWLSSSRYGSSERGSAGRPMGSRPASAAGPSPRRGRAAARRGRRATPVDELDLGRVRRRRPAGTAARRGRRSGPGSPSGDPSQATARAPPARPPFGQAPGRGRRRAPAADELGPRRRPRRARPASRRRARRRARRRRRAGSPTPATRAARARPAGCEQDQDERDPAPASCGERSAGGRGQRRATRRGAVGAGCAAVAVAPAGAGCSQFELRGAQRERLPLWASQRVVEGAVPRVDLDVLGRLRSARTLSIAGLRPSPGRCPARRAAAACRPSARRSTAASLGVAPPLGAW